MMWLVWRQHRKQAMFLLVGLAALALVLVPTGRQAHDAAAAYARCLDGLGTAALMETQRTDVCQTLGERFANTHTSWAFASILLLFLPLLVGLFWGAPLVAREVEQGTHRLVWTQSVSRTRWMFAKLGLTGAVILVVAIAYTLLLSWWMEPLNGTIVSRMSYLSFDQQGVAPIGYTLFAVAAGVFAGTLTRKVLPAMAITLVAFLAARVVVTLLVRPNIMEPVARTVPVAGDTPREPNPALGDWILSADIYNADGTLRQAGATAFCSGEPGAPCSTDTSYNQWTLQPGDRYWLFQWVEVSLFVLVAAVLLTAAAMRVRRHIS
jgi:hypothetical protein